MTESDVFEYFKGENEQCYKECDGECSSVENGKCTCRDGLILSMLQELQQYHSIGTVEECREAMKRQTRKKPKFEMNFGDYESRFSCKCGKKIVIKHNRGVMDNNDAPNYCLNCGQKLDWSDTP